uniref:NADH dehydrogenase subunit 6 n=1 Tax=Neoseiulus womersleyi TaxID=322050 RepID=A0A8F6U387_9ACAR|nr:NADH dehydrogenase subunit 6 [Neoseiulus womersleyi]
MPFLLSIILSMFLLSPHPMMKILILLKTMIILLTLMSMSLKSSWMSMMFCLVMISSLMIIFLYFTSLTKQIKIKTQNKSIITFKLIFILLVMKIYKLEISQIFINLKDSISLNIFSNSNMNILFFLLMILMLVSLLIMIEMISNMKSSFRINN